MDRSVARPVPPSQRADSRRYQLNQLQRRFSAREIENLDNTTTLVFDLVPTDPDFPFDLPSLHCSLRLPQSWPASVDQKAPSLRVTNAEMDRGYQINIERGFDNLVSSMPGRTLLALFNELDRQLENFLTSEKVQTVKLVNNSIQAAAGKNVRRKIHYGPTAGPRAVTSSTAKGPSSQVETNSRHSPQRLAAAQEKRESDIRQLEARVGRQPLFARANDDLSFSIPILQLHRSDKLPAALQGIKVFQLLVPRYYNLEPCTIILETSLSEHADNVEAAFERHARNHPNMTLTAHVNHLAQNIHAMAYETVAGEAAVPEIAGDTMTGTTSQVEHEERKTNGKRKDDERPYLHIIPRPPEWSKPADEEKGESSGSSEMSSSEDESDFASDDDDGGAALSLEEPQQTAGSNTDPEYGVRLSFPALELYGTELLQVEALSLTVKCTRCKEAREVKNIKSAHNKADEQSLVKTESCNKCANPISVGFRSEPMHANSVRAGTLDLNGCTVVDLLPSYFIPTCSSCSTPHPAPGVISVRGECTLSICRECHQKATFKIPEVKFLRISSHTLTTPLPLRRRKPQKEALGITAGEPLPHHGRCKHYSKSHRWFRFSCCSKVYPCDKCHNDRAKGSGEDHPNEHANRMICGYCSREQTYRPEDCAICHAVLVRKHRGERGGFWEGGKGTRDPVRMSRKDPRKYKNRAKRK